MGAQPEHLRAVAHRQASAQPRRASAMAAEGNRITPGSDTSVVPEWDSTVRVTDGEPMASASAPPGSR